MGSRSALAPQIDGFLSQVVDLSDDSTTVYTGSGVIRGFYVNTTISNHTTDVDDDTTNLLTIAAQTPAGTWTPVGDIEFLTSLIVDPDNAATGSITVVYKPYGNS